MNTAFSLLIPLTAATTHIAANNVQESKRPNILFILVDDMGYGDLTCYGSAGNDTPHIDALARQGKRFTHMYAGSAVSTPSRVSILTGRFPIRYDVRHVFRDKNEYLIPQETNLARLLNNAGYHTAHVGKWHLGGLRIEDIQRRKEGKRTTPGPLQQGFDYASTSIEGLPIRRDLMLGDSLYRKGGKHMIINDEFASPRLAHLEDLKTSDVMDLMESFSKTDKPFFINLCYDAPHDPYEPAPEKHLKKYEAMGVTGKQLYFRSMVSHLDECIGRLEDKLKELGIYDNTLIIFTSDNGPARQGSPGVFKGGKSDLHEGGLRVPGFVVWNNVVPKGTVSHDICHFTDFLPTLCAIAKANTSNINSDGENILSMWTAPEEVYTERTKKMFFQLDKSGTSQLQAPRPMPHISVAAIDGKWKLTADIINDKLTLLELFDLRNDQRELKNLLGEHPEVEKELQDFMEKVLAEKRWEWDRNLGIYDN